MGVIKSGYKQTEIGVIPVDWNVVELGEIIIMLGGGTFKSRDRCSNGIKWLKISNVAIGNIKWDELEYLPSYFSKNYNDFLLEEDDVVMALTRPILSNKLKIAIISNIDAPCLLNQRVGKVLMKNDNCLKWMYQVLQSNFCVKGLLDSMAGTDPPNLSNKGIYSLKIPLPPTKEEQEAIATALSDMDALIANLDALIAKKKAIKKGAMQQLLTPPNKGGKRLPGFSGEWVEKSFGEVFNLKQGLQCEVEKQFIIKKPNYTRFIRIIDLTNNDEIPRYIEKPSESHMLKKNDLFMVRYGTPGLLGIGYEGVIANNLFRLIPRLEFDTKYFYYYFNYKNDEILNLSSSTTMAAISFSSLNTLETEFPPRKEEQEAIATILSDMDKEINALEAKKAKSIQLKQGMAQELLTGKTRLV